MAKEFVHRVQRHLSSKAFHSKVTVNWHSSVPKEGHKHVSEKRTVSGFNCSRLLDHLQKSRQLKGKGSQEECSMVVMLLA